MTEDTADQKFLRWEDHVLVDKPSINEEDCSHFSFESPQYVNLIIEFLSEKGITPTKYPLALDLFAGQGPIGAKLIENGWLPENCWNIDIRKPKDPPKGTKWVYANLSYLARALRKPRTSLPDEIEKLRGKFDIVTVFFSFAGAEEVFTLGDFFLKTGGVICPEHYYPPEELKDRWKSLEGTVLYRKK